MTLIFLYLSLLLINVVTLRNPGLLGSIGEKVSSTVYGRTVDKDTGKETNKMHLAFILVN
jgi:hypothetical protein